jgi:hypothetical protein
MAEELPDFKNIMAMAQKVASQIQPPPELRSGKKLNAKDMERVVGNLTKTVASSLPSLMAEMNGGNTSMNDSEIPKIPKNSKISLGNTSVNDSEISQIPKNSKISLGKQQKEKKKRIIEVETDSESDEDTDIKRTKDMNFTLSVTLEDIYHGKKKKLAMRRQKLETDGSFIEEKKKLSINVEPGMIDEQTIRFNHMADEKQGFETGDVVVSLDVEEHGEFIRDGNNLLIEREISISDSYEPVIYIKHLNGKLIKVNGDPLDVFSDDDELKKVVGMGMPIHGENGKFGDLFIKFKCINNFNPTDENIEAMKKLFPPILDKNVDTELEIEEKCFELVTESDLEFLEDSDDDSDSEEDSDDFETESED